MSDLATLNTTTAMAIPAGVDPFAAVADTEVGMEGAFLKFKDGIWRLGKDKTVIKPDEQFAALIGDAQHGYVKWVDRKVASRIMVRVADSLAPARAELGDTDPDDWLVGPKGPEDPFSFTYLLPLISIEDETRLIFTTSSLGGRRAVGKLCKEYSQQRRKVPSTQYAIVELGCDSDYTNSNGNIVQRPLFRIIEWVADAVAPATTPATMASTIMSRHLNDEIPFGN